MSKKVSSVFNIFFQTNLRRPTARETNLRLKARISQKIGLKQTFFTAIITEKVFPHCLHPLIINGLWFGVFFHSNKLCSIFLFSTTIHPPYSGIDSIISKLSTFSKEFWTKISTFSNDFFCQVSTFLAF